MDLINKKKPNHGFFIFLLVIAIYAGYCIGKLAGQEVTLDNMTTLFCWSLLHPIPFRITSLTLKAILVCIMVWLVVYAYHISSTFRNYMPGREYGSGQIAKPHDINKALADQDPKKNKIISENVRISMNTRFTGLNNNMLVVGGSGSGKSFFMVKPNGYNCGYTSYVFTDPKGELLRDIGHYLELMGYKIVVLNLVDLDHSDCYNPFAYIRCDEDVTKLITSLIANTTPKGTTPSDPFWEKAESMLLQALFLYVWYEYPKMGKTPNIRGVLDLLNKERVSDNRKEKSDLHKIMYALPADHPALVTYKKVCSGAADTIRSIVISAQARLSYLQNPKILHILDHDDTDIPALGEGVYRNPDRKVAMFCVIPDNDKSYNFIVGLLYTQIFQELYYIADHKYGGALPVHVALWMDEFANCALPDGFLEILSTCRSREISCNIIIQNLAQLKTLFKDSWENICGNCDTLVYLGGNEQSTHKYMSEMLGKATIDKKTSGETLGNHGSSSRNYDVLGRDILDPSEVRKVDNTKCLIFIRGFDPVYDDKYHTAIKEDFKFAMKLGNYEHKENKLSEGRDVFYLLAEGDPTVSFTYQIESYLGLFDGTPALDMFREEAAKMPRRMNTEEYCMAEVGAGYVYEKCIVYPVISKNAVSADTTLGRLSKYAVIGYFNSHLNRSYLASSDADFKNLSNIFCEGNRRKMKQAQEGRG